MLAAVLFNPDETRYTSAFGSHPVFDVALYEDGYQCCSGCCLTGRVNKFFVDKVVYDVRVINGDGQEVVLEAGLEVQ